MVSRKRVRYQCEDQGCKKFFDTQAKLDSHTKLIHRHDASAIIEPKAVEPEVEDTRPFKCDFKDCEYSSRTAKGLRQHQTLRSHGGDGPGRSTLYRKAALADGAQGALKHMTAENIRLGEEVEELNDRLYDVYQELDSLKYKDKTTTPGTVARGFDVLTKLVNGDPDGTTEEAKLGLQRCLEIAIEANETLQELLDQARQGLIPEAWLADIKRDLSTSIEMIVTGIRDTSRDKNKAAKYDELVKFLKESN